MRRRIVTAREQHEMLSPWQSRDITAGRPDYVRPMGININDTHQDYTGQILRGEKTIETRDTRSLNPYVGRRIALFRTHDSKRVPTLVVGHATVGEPVHYPDVESFDADYDRHLVGPDSPHHFTNAKYGEKYGYPMLDPVALDRPMLVNSRGNVARGAEDADFAPYDGPWPLHTAMTKRKPVYFALHPKNPGHAMAYWGDRREPIAEVKWTTKGKPGYSEDWEPTPEEQGSVDWVWSHPHARRKGITRSLLQWVKDNHEPNLHGSTNMTPAGKALSEALGEHVDDSHWNRLQPVRGYNRPIEDAPYRMVDEGREKWEANGRPGNYI